MSRAVPLTRVHLLEPVEPGGELRVLARIRSRHQEQPARLELLGGGRGRLVFDEPVRAAAPGQSAVFFDPAAPSASSGAPSSRDPLPAEEPGYPAAPLTFDKLTSNLRHGGNVMKASELKGSETGTSSRERSVNPLRYARQMIAPGVGGRRVFTLLVPDACRYACSFCPMAGERSLPNPLRTTQGLARLFMTAFRRGLCDGLFLMAGVPRNPVRATARMIELLETLRVHHGFRGYVHVKAVPGAEAGQVQKLVQARRPGFVASRACLRPRAAGESDGPPYERDGALLEPGEGRGGASRGGPGVGPAGSGASAGAGNRGADAPSD